MIKAISIFTVTVLLAGFAYAGYDVSTESFPNANYPSRPYSVTVEDTASDIVSTDYIQLFNTLTGSSFILDASKVAGLGSGATTAEISKVADDSARIVAISTGATTASCAVNGTGKINLITAATDATITLPAATGSGCTYEFEWSTLPAATGQTGDVIQVTGNDEFRGVLATLSDDSAGVKGFAMAGGGDNDKLTFTSSTKYVATKGVTIKFKDTAADVWHVEGTGSSTGSEATPAATGQRS